MHLSVHAGHFTGLVSVRLANYLQGEDYKGNARSYLNKGKEVSRFDRFTAAVQAFYYRPQQ